MSLAAFIADQRTGHRVPHTVACRALGVSPYMLRANARRAIRSPHGADATPTTP